jgi:pyruvate,water dikinase
LEGNNVIYPFTSTPLPTLIEVGGKGLSLIKMTQADLPVPPGFVCPVTFFEPWLTALQATPEWTAVQKAIQNEEDLHPSTSALKTACAKLTITDEQEKQLTAAQQALPGGNFYAVRSSSPEEDLEGASFAGGYKTTLGVTKDTMLAALQASFASAFDERVFVYKQQHGFAVERPRIALVVQQQITSETAGVGFSLNPLNNDYDEAVIDASWGLGESVVAGMVTPDHFVVDKVSKNILERKLGGKETVVTLTPIGGVQEQASPDPGEFCLTDEQVIAITEMLIQIETLYNKPIDIEWAYAGGKLFLLQARPITAYIPLAPEMMTEPGERRILYMDIGLTEGMTINRPMMPLTIDWLFGSAGMFVTPLMGPIELRANNEPSESLMFGVGGRYYLNLSQILTVVSAKMLADEARAGDALLAELMENIDRAHYKADKKIKGLRWWSILRHTLRALWAARHSVAKILAAFWRPEEYYQYHTRMIDKAVSDLQQTDYSDLSLRELIDKLDTELTPVIAKAALPPIAPYFYYMGRLGKIFGDDSEENKRLLESLTLGFAGNEAVDIGIHLYRLAKMLVPTDFTDLDHLAQRLKARNLPDEFLMAWDEFVSKYGLRGPGELELANARYGDDPRLALEQMSYMVDSDFDPGEMQKEHVAARQQAYIQLLQKVSGRKRRQLERVYKILDLLGPTRDTPKYLWVLDNGAVRRRALQEGQMFVDGGRLDAPEDIFWLTIDEIDAANADPTYDLRQKRDEKQPFYRKLDQVLAFPHMIDSRGRIGQVEKPLGDPNILTGLGISRGVATGRVKVLHTPRQKPIEKGDVLVAYTTDPGWTPLFINAEAVILEVGGMLQHGGVVAREYGKPCVAGIQGVTTTLQDGQLVEVDGTTGMVCLLD